MSDSPTPNPFFRPFPAPFLRREFLGLMTASWGWTIVSSYGADDAPEKGKGPKGRGGRGGGNSSEYVLPEFLAEFATLSIILGRATDKTMTFSALAKETLEGYFEIGTVPGKYVIKTAVTTFQAGEPTELLLGELTPNTEYFYRANYRKPGAAAFTHRPECRFATQRAPGSTFTFTIQGDSHPERPQSSHPELYARTLQTAAADGPDFHICIGDDFSVEKIPTTSSESLAAPYLLQRPFLGLIGQSAPVFLLNGNHEQASLYNYNQIDERRTVAIATQVARNRLYPTPAPDAFYSGNTEALKDIGLLKNYCAWTWGDALFIILDNYWHSPALVDSGFKGEDARQPRGEKGKSRGNKNRDWWGITIGDAQYQWLKETLETSGETYKFVFAHHVLGTGRGGIDGCGMYEWGGEARRGEGTFAENRPTWPLPIHQLMVKHKVNIFFQGHDHLYCQQEKDGIIYQEVPMPSDHGYVAYNEDRYQSGTKLPSSGYLRVTVSPVQVTVDYVRCYLPKDEGPDTQQGAIAHTYKVQANSA